MGQASAVPPRLFRMAPIIKGRRGRGDGEKVKRSRVDWGLVHFSAKRRILRANGRPKRWTCPLHATQGGESRFRGSQAISQGNVPCAAKIGTVSRETLIPNLTLRTAPSALTVHNRTPHIMVLLKTLLLVG